MVGQDKLDFRVQIVEVDEKPIEDLDDKRRTHVAFLSNDPRLFLNEIDNWAKSKNIRFRQGGWNEKELYFDLPDIFVNFVIEVMHSSIVKE